MVNRVQTIRYYTTLERPPVTEYAGELYINYADLQIGALNTAKSPVDFVAVRYYSQLALYVEGDYAVYNGLLYRCIRDTVVGAFDASRWSELLDLQEVTVLIAVETANRQAADQVLQNEINAEINNRQNADASLQNQINATNVALGALLPPGISLDYYGVNPPPGWLLEDGSVYAMSTYPALGALLGNKFGGDGTTSFAVPPSLTRFGVAAGAGFPLGSMGGATTATLNTTNLPSHTHTIQPHIHTGTVGNHTHPIDWGLVTVFGEGIEGGVAPMQGFLPDPNTHTGVSSGAINVNPSLTLTTDPNTGGGTPISILPPYISRTRIIKT